VRFRYTYQDHDGRCREDAVTAQSKSAAYAALRRAGIRPMKVWLAKGERMRLAILLALAAVGLLAALAGLFVLTFRSGERAGRVDAAVRNADDSDVAAPLPRRAFPRPTRPVDWTFRADAVLARFARPGVPVELSADEIRAFASDIDEALGRPIVLDDADAPDVVLLKRIVAGLRQEARIALGCGESPEAVLVRFVERQRMEAAYRVGILRELRSLPDAVSRESRRQEVNASLRPMGLAEISPDEL